ncbi:hypothetical protein [Saccharopolyspora thermophila]|nr:hypothetical protein [Saccharopolyspora subtropica]
MSEADILTSQLDQAFNGLEEKVQECVDKFNAAVHHIVDWAFVLGPAMLYINPRLDEVREGLEKLVKLVRTAVEHHLPVVSLIVQSNKWVADVKAPMNKLTHSTEHLLYYWEGKASEAYKDKVGQQNEAIAFIVNRADAVSAWLMDIAKYNVEYMCGLTRMATDFLGALVAASIEAATVVEIPFAVQNLAGAIGTLVTQYLNNLVDTAKRFVEALSKVRDLKSVMTDRAIVDDRWPQAVIG